ncbi:Crossover junction endonuclease mus81 [Ancistrocladus abbreviatus]
MYFSRYMLTEEGRRGAQECMSRSNMIDAVKRSDGSRELSSDSDRQDRVDLEITGADSAREARPSSVDLSGEDSLINIPPQFLERVITHIYIVLVVYLFSCIKPLLAFSISTIFYSAA